MDQTMKAATMEKDTEEGEEDDGEGLSKEGTDSDGWIVVELLRRHRYRACWLVVHRIFMLYAAIFVSQEWNSITTTGLQSNLYKPDPILLSL